MGKQGRKCAAPAFSWLDIPQSVTEYAHFTFRGNVGESMEHPTPQILKDLLLGRLAAEDEKAVITHLMTGCPQCREEIAPAAAILFRPARTAASPSSDDEDLYDRAIAFACEAALERQRGLDRERVEADAKIDQLLSGKKVQKSFWTWGLCERLQERSWELRQKDPSAMVELAQCAVEAAQRISPRKYGAEHAADLLARAWAGLANGYRISDQFALAETAFSEAFAARQRGTGSPFLQARLAEISASLLCDQRHFPTAFQLLDFAHGTYLKHHAPHDAGRALIQRGIHTGRSGDPEEGIQLLARGLKLIDRDRDSKLVFQSLHNILLLRVELGEFKLARRQIWEMRPLYTYNGDLIAQMKLRWIEGKVFEGLGQLDRASRAFQQAKDAFLQKGMDYDAALVSFDLAALWLQEGKRDKVRQLLREMLETFRARYIAREAIAALIMLRDAADRDELSLDLLEMISGLFHAFKPEPKEGGDAAPL
jgi:tetratricopeptide (TPR) repeat protein